MARRTSSATCGSSTTPPTGALAAGCDASRRAGAARSTATSTPRCHGRGLGGQLVEWGEARARELGFATVHNAILSTDAARRALLASRGYRPVRHFWRMVIDARRRPSRSPLARRHRGPHLRSRRRARALRRRPRRRSPTTGAGPSGRSTSGGRGAAARRASTRACFLAGTAASSPGYSICAPRRSAAASSDLLGVRPRVAAPRPGLALLLHSFRELRTRGVDTRRPRRRRARTPTGATRLYESAGMRVLVAGRHLREGAGAVSRLRAKCPDCGDVHGGRDRARVRVPRCGRDLRAPGSSACPRAWGEGGEAMAEAAYLPLPYPEAAVVERARSPSRRSRVAAELPERPLVLGGCCCAHVGAVEGLAARHGGSRVVWLDAHGDLNTPESSPSGNAWGMPLRMAHRPRRRRPARTWRSSARATSTRRRRRSSPRPGSTGEDGVDAALDGADGVYVALDVDVLDADEVAVFMPEPGGLDGGRASRRCCAGVAATPDVAGAGVTGLAPGPGERRAGRAAARRASACNRPGGRTRSKILLPMAERIDVSIEHKNLPEPEPGGRRTRTRARPAARTTATTSSSGTWRLPAVRPPLPGARARAHRAARRRGQLRRGGRRTSAPTIRSTSSTCGPTPSGSPRRSSNTGLGEAMVIGTGGDRRPRRASSRSWTSRSWAARWAASSARSSRAPARARPSAACRSSRSPRRAARACRRGSSR